ncbi:MAG: hypothetical protein L0387_34135 [Acidobacteria bacterium]|nr:hypothetical protein [Acidobacteriota bacterium]
MIIARIIQLQFLLLLVFLVCTSVAGEKDAALWYCVVILLLGSLAVARMIARSRR